MCTFLTSLGLTSRLEPNASGELARLARTEDLWLHVDAAYGGGAMLSERDGDRVAGLALANSVTLDPHTWCFQAYDVGSLLVRRRDDLQQAFHRTPEYLRSPEDEPLDWYQFSMEGSRRFRGLKLWMSWKHLGTVGLSHLVEGTNDLAAYMNARCQAHPAFEPALPEPELSVVCFRVLPPGAQGRMSMRTAAGCSPRCRPA